MDNELLKILSKELRETKNLVVETRKMVIETRRSADAAQQTANEAARKADAAWEQVIITRNKFEEELRYMRLPWWKKLSGRAA